MVDVRGGTFTFGMNNEDVMGDWNNLQTRKTVSSFRIDKYEVSNKKYRDYMNRWRYFADEAGTNFSIRVKIPFSSKDL